MPLPRLGLWMTAAVLMAAAASVQAKPQHKDTLRRHFGDRLPAALHTCATCHVVPEGKTERQLAEEGPEHNAFGERLAELRDELEKKGLPSDLPRRLEHAADEDADGDGLANELEILAGRFPGDAGDGDKAKPSAEELARVEAIQKKFRARYRWRPLEPIQRPAVPSENLPAPWQANPIDAFVARQHQDRGLVPRSPASREALLRRVYLDLIGLPPTREQLHEFLADSSPDAYDRVVDRLLASEQYGERWGRHWMDVWRYSDWAGWNEQVRDSQPHIWRWRDWIVESLNADKPYDRMVRQMLAADELAPQDDDALRATGFLVRNFKLLSREQWMQDTVEHTAEAFLGLTLKCARCHDHMYDPLPQTDYYRFRAFFEPYEVRIDRLPGNADTAKQGLVRVYDAKPDAATYVYHRGDDRDPDKEHPVVPGVPEAAGGGTLTVTPVELPRSAFSPDKRPFVIEEELRAGQAAVTAAREKLAQAQQAAESASETEKPTDTERAAAGKPRELQLDVSLAEARLSALQAVLAVESLDDRRVDPLEANDIAAREEAARMAHLAQRQLALLVARKAASSAEQELAAAEDKKDNKAIEAARQKLKEAQDALAKHQKRQDAPATTEFEPRKLAVYPATSTGRRTALARWLTDPANPLFARVAANHLWLRHFGQGLAGSPVDFGANAPLPSHPALLDWLAAELISPSQVRQRDGDRMRWISSGDASPGKVPAPFSMKHVHRLIVTSQTYRLASHGRHEATRDVANRRADPDNRFYWRAPTRRMEAEVVRDSVLHVAGSLDLAQGGPDIDPQQGLTSTRRSLYFRHAPEKQMPFLKLFDAAAPSECYQRKESIIPQQALALVNSQFTHRQARILARSLSKQIGDREAEFVPAAFEQVLSRLPSGEELVECEQFLVDQRKLLEANLPKGESTNGSPADANLPAADPALRARESLVHVLLNHHEFVTIP